MELNKSSLIVAVLIILVGATTSDLDHDIAMCQDQLLTLSTCNGFIFGSDKSPISECCCNLSQQFNTTKKCLCTLVKDRNEPNFPLQIDGLVALSLPTKCSITYNPLECLDLLQLPRSSPDAQVFVEYYNTLQTNITASGPAPTPSSNSDDTSSAGGPPPTSNSDSSQSDDTSNTVVPGFYLIVVVVSYLVL